MPLDVETVSFGIVAVLLVASGLASALVKRTFHSVMFLGVFLVAVAALYILLGSPLIGIIQVLVYVGGILTLFVFAVMFVAGDESEAAESPPPAPRSNLWSIAAAVVIAGVATVSGFLLAPLVYGAVEGFFLDLGWFSGWVGGEVNWARIPAFGLAALALVAVAVAGIVAWLAVRRILDTWAFPRILGAIVAGALAVTMFLVVIGSAAWAGLVATDADSTAANDLATVVDALFSEQAVPLEILGVLLTAVMIGALVLARPLRAPPDEAHYARVTPEQLRESQLASDVRLHTAAAPASPPPTPPAPGDTGGAP